MRSTPWATYLWPGLPQLWTDGTWSGLACALAYSALLNLLILTSFVWEELLAGPLVLAGWFAAIVVWVAAIVVTRRTRPQAVVEKAAAPVEDLFCAALGEYLQGHWFEAETLLSRIFEHRPRDVEARLLLATLLRRTKRCTEAREQIARLECIENASVWSVEIAREKQLLAQITPKSLSWAEQMMVDTPPPAAKAA